MSIEKSPEQIELDNLVKAAYDAISTAEDHADKHGLKFRFSIAGDLGATYYGKTHEDRENYEEFGGWYSSYFNY